MTVRQATVPERVLSRVPSFITSSNTSKSKERTMEPPGEKMNFTEGHERRFAQKKFLRID